MRKLAFAVPLAVLLGASLGGACKSSDPGTPGGAGGASASPEGKVAGTALDTHLTDLGPATAADTGTIEAVFGAAGAVSTVQGAIGADGAFLLAVPAGTSYRWHYVGSEVWQVSSARTLDLGALVAGRPGLQRPTLATALAFTVTGLVPWHDGSPVDPKKPNGPKLPTDALELTSLGGGSYILLSKDLPAETPILRDATDAKGTIDLQKDPFASLLDGTAGDVAYVTQLVGHQEGTLSWTALERAVKTKAPDVADGQGAKLSAALEPVDLVAHELDWQRSKFAALLSDIPAAATQTADLDVFVEPDKTVSSSGWFFADLLIASSPSMVNDDPDKDVLFTAKLGNPFTTMLPVVSAGLTFRVPGLLPNSADTKSLTGTITVRVKLDGGALLPTLGPPRNPTVSGFAAVVVPPTTSGGGGGGGGTSIADAAKVKPFENVGTSPTLAWDAPTLGKPTHYVVTVRKIDVAGPSSLAGRVFTRSASATLPESMLEKGAPYYARIAAVEDSLWSEETPFRHAVESATAETVTPIFVP